MATSGTFYGTTSNEYIQPRIVWSAVQSFDSNSSTITATLSYLRTSTNNDSTAGYWDGSITIDGHTTTVDNKYIKITKNGYVTALSYTVTIPHELDGSKTLTISATGLIPSTSLSSTTISAEITLDPFERLSTLSASNGTLGIAQTLTVNQLVPSFPHSITYTCGKTSGTVVTKSSETSISWTPPLTLAQQNVTGTSVSVTLSISTFSGNTNIGTRSVTIVCNIPASVKPSCALTLSDTTGHATTYGKYIKGVSKLAVTVTPTLAQNATITAYKTVVNGATYTESSFTTDILKTAGTLKVDATVTDTRNRIGTASKSVSVYDYTAPSISEFTVHRCNADGSDNDQGEHVKVKFVAAVTSLDSQNNATYSVQYKKSTAASYTSVTLTAYQGSYFVDDGEYIFAADSGASYDVRLTVTDAFGSITRTTSASTASTLMHWKADGTGMAIGKVSELSNTFEVAFKTKMTGGVQAILLEYGDDLDGILTPNVYEGRYGASIPHPNSPTTTAFVLEVFQVNNGSQIVQRLTPASYGNKTVYTRVYVKSENAWKDWTSDGARISDLETKTTNIETAITTKCFADGYVYIEFGAMPTESKSVGVNLPSGAKNYWIDSAWVVMSGMRFMFPTGTYDAYLSSDGGTLTVECNRDVSGYTGFFVIAYKL